jgi:hypothetical protein
MNEFDKRISITLGTFGALLAMENVESSLCVLAATALWVWRSVANRV